MLQIMVYYPPFHRLFAVLLDGDIGSGSGADLLSGGSGFGTGLRTVVWEEESRFLPRYVYDAMEVKKQFEDMRVSCCFFFCMVFFLY